MRVRATISVEGRVQGVGFRSFAMRTARLIGGITGFVHNMQEETQVQIVCEGERGRIDALLASLRAEAPPHIRIEDIQVGFSRATGEFSSFTEA